MKLYEQIRKAHEREQLSIRELARRFGVHRRDVRQALSSAVPPDRKAPSRRQPSPLDPWKTVIDGWLDADRTAPRKQRHTARRVWQRLTEEHGVVVGESTVRRYVAEVRRRMDVPLVEVMVPQHHPLGEEAEVDFGTASVVLAGALIEVSMFVLRLSASGRGREAQEPHEPDRPDQRLETHPERIVHPLPRPHHSGHQLAMTTPVTHTNPQSHPKTRRGTLPGRVPLSLNP